VVGPDLDAVPDREILGHRCRGVPFHLSLTEGGSLTPPERPPFQFALKVFQKNIAIISHDKRYISYRFRKDKLDLY
jgi:hypothetical protein